MSKTVNGNDICTRCSHKRFRHMVEKKEGNRVCMNMTCACPDFVEPFTPAEMAELGIKFAQTAGPGDYAKARRTTMFCTDCKHNRLAHLDSEKPEGVGECHQADCQCSWFMPDLVMALEKLPDAVDSPPEEHDDPVNHPSHYTGGKGPEVIETTRWMNFNRGNAVKYICRAGKKDPDKEIEDIEKAIWYLNDELKILRGEV